MKAVIAWILGCFGFWASAATYYVSPTGDNGNDGLTALTPWTLAKGVTNLAPDVTVLMLDGTYTGLVNILDKSGTDGHPATLKAVNKWQAWVKDSSYEGVRVEGTCSYIVVDGLRISNCNLPGVALEDGSVVRNCWISYITNDSGITLFPRGNGSVSGIVEDNVIEYCGSSDQSHGVYWHGRGNVVRRNISRYNSGWGLHLYTGTAGVTNHLNQIYNNLTYGNTNKYGITLWNANGNDGSCVGTNYAYNNTILDGLDVDYGVACITNNIIIAQPGDARILHSVDRPCTVYADYNMSDGSLTPDNGAHDVIGDPMFFGAPDYRLSQGSGAIGAGLALNDIFTTDILSTTRGPSWDLGAYEYVGYPSGGGSGVSLQVVGRIRGGSVRRP